MLLNSPSEEYESFSVAMESRDEIQTLDLRAKFKEEEARQNDRSVKMSDGDKKSDALMTREGANREKHLRGNPHVNSKDGSARINSQKFDGKCFNCDTIEYRSRDCRAKLKQNKNKTNNSDN